MSKEDILVLTDTEALKTRYEHVLEVSPDREGVRRATPLDVFTRFKRYVSDSLNEDNVRRSFPARNKRFMEAFGNDCDLLLYRMGFRKAEDENGDDQWTIPSPKSVDHPDSLRPMLERLVIELQYLMDDYCASHAAPNPSRPAYRDAKVDIARTLSAQDCMRIISCLIVDCADKWQTTRSRDAIWAQTKRIIREFTQPKRYQEQGLNSEQLLCQSWCSRRFLRSFDSILLRKTGEL